MRSVLFPSLLVAGLLLPACASEASSGDSNPVVAASPAETGAPPTVANTVEPTLAPEFVNYNKDLPKRGDSLPTILGSTLSGGTVNNALFSGKTTLINLWFYH